MFHPSLSLVVDQSMAEECCTAVPLANRHFPAHTGTGSRENFADWVPSGRAVLEFPADLQKHIGRLAGVAFDSVTATADMPAAIGDQSNSKVDTLQGRKRRAEIPAWAGPVARDANSSLASPASPGLGLNR